MTTEGTNVFWMDDYSKLTARQGTTGTGPSDPAVAIVEGYAARGDGGGGSFVWTADTTTADDGGTIIVPSGTRTGCWKRQFSGPVDVRWFGAKCDGSDDRAALLAACGASDHVRISGPVRCASNTTIPSGVTLHFDRDGSMLVPDSGTSLTIQGGVEASPTQHIFGGSGTTRLTPATTTQPEVVDVWVGWFGAKGDSDGSTGSGTDNTGPIQKAIDACASAGPYQAYGGRVRLARGRYRISAPITVNLGSDQQCGLHILGEVAGASMSTFDTYIVCDFDNTLDKGGTTYTVGALSSGNLTLTGLAGLASSDVGQILYMTGCSRAGNVGAFVITAVTSSTSATVSVPRGVANDGAGSPSAVTGRWIIPQQNGIRLCSRDCILEGLAIGSAATKFVKAAVETTQGNHQICTNNVLRRVGVYGDLNPGGVMVGFLHGAPLSPGGSAPADCENHRFERCYAQYTRFSSYWCPNGIGQTKKICFDDCAFNTSPYHIIQSSGGFIFNRGDLSNASEYSIVTGILDQMVISDVQSEGCARFWTGPGYGSSTMAVQLYGGRYSLDGIDPDKTWIRAHSATTLTMVGVHFDQTYDPDFQFIIDNDTLMRPFTLVAIGCDFPNVNPARKTASNYQLRAQYIGCFGVDPTELDARLIANTSQTDIALSVGQSGGVLTCDFSNYMSNTIYAAGAYSVVMPYPSDLTVLSNAYPITRRYLMRIAWTDNSASLTWPSNLSWGAGGAPTNPGGITSGHYKIQTVDLVFDAQVMGWFATAGGVSALI